MSDLTDWLRAQIDEDELAAKVEVFPHRIKRSLAEVELKRRILERHLDCGTGVGYCDDGGHGWEEDGVRGCADLLDLVLPYADRPGYRPEWNPDAPA